MITGLSPFSQQLPAVSARAKTQALLTPAAQPADSVRFGNKLPVYTCTLRIDPQLKPASGDPEDVRAALAGIVQQCELLFQRSTLTPGEFTVDPDTAYDTDAFTITVTASAQAKSILGNLKEVDELTFTQPGQSSPIWRSYVADLDISDEPLHEPPPPGSTLAEVRKHRVQQALKHKAWFNDEVITPLLKQLQLEGLDQEIQLNTVNWLSGALYFDATEAVVDRLRTLPRVQSCDRKERAELTRD